MAGRGSVPGHRGKASAGVAVGKKVSPSPNKDNKVTEGKGCTGRPLHHQSDDVVMIIFRQKEQAARMDQTRRHGQEDSESVQRLPVS